MSTVAFYGIRCYFDFLLRRHLVLNLFPFPFRGEFHYNRRSTANSALRLFFRVPDIVPILVALDFYSAYGQSTVKKKNPRNLFIGATNSPRFAYWHGECAAL